MVTVEKIIAELKIGGYLDAAEYIERQFATINRTAEFGCIGIAGTPAAGLRRTW